MFLLPNNLLFLGDKLASLGSTPDYMLTIWDWRREKIILRSKAHGQVTTEFMKGNGSSLESWGSHWGERSVVSKGNGIESAMPLFNGPGPR